MGGHFFFLFFSQVEGMRRRGDSVDIKEYGKEI